MSGLAELHLRGRSGPIRLRAYWPSAPAPGLLVCFPGGGGADGSFAHRCVAAGVVVLALPEPAGFEEAVTVTGWSADHAAELGADPANLLVAGVGTGGGLAAAVALAARDRGWPPLSRQVLVHPRLAVQPAGPYASPLRARSLAGVAPAVVVTVPGDPHQDGSRYAARLRRAGVAVEERPDPDLAIDQSTLNERK